MEENANRINLEKRGKAIIRAGIIGILANLVLASFKVLIGFLSKSISIVLDGVNNLTDALSSVLTIVGMKLSEKPADRDHPMGHGRTEYLTASAISLIVLYAGISSLVESVKKILKAEKPEYTRTMLLLLFVGVLIKVFLGIFVRKMGIKVHSDSLKAQGQDALQDAVISSSTIVAALVFLWHLFRSLPRCRDFSLHHKVRLRYPRRNAFPYPGRAHQLLFQPGYPACHSEDSGNLRCIRSRSA